jgi:SAM-dependent methyltransferase
MAQSKNDFTGGSIPSFYENGLGPNIFHDYADDLAIRSGGISGSRILELAAGTGIVSRRLRDAMSPHASLVVSDLSDDMLEIASGKFGSDEDVEFVLADAMALPFDDSEFDAIVCQFGVMFFPDKPNSFKEAARVLTSGGRYIFNTWGPMSANPYSRISHETVSEFFPVDPPGFYKAPFAYGDPVEVRNDLNAAGWDDVEHETVHLNKPVTDPHAFAKAMIFGTPTIDLLRERGGVDPDEIVDVIHRRFLDQFGDGPTIMPLQATVFICRAPTKPD